MQDLRTDDGKSSLASVVAADETSVTDADDAASLSTIVSADETIHQTTPAHNLSSLKVSDADQTFCENDSVADRSLAQFTTELLLGSAHQPSPSFSGYGSNSHESDAELEGHESIESVGHESAAHESKVDESCAHESIGHDSDSLVFSDACELHSSESAIGSNAHLLLNAPPQRSLSSAGDGLQPSMTEGGEDGGLLNGRPGLLPRTHPKDSRPLRSVIQPPRTKQTIKDNAFSCKPPTQNGLSSRTMTNVLTADDMTSSVAQQPCMTSCTNNQVSNSRNDFLTSKGLNGRRNSSKKSNIFSYLSPKVCRNTFID